jgi:Uma2 family endonuclease
MKAPSSPKKRPATYADVEAAPEHLVAEIIDGELMTHPRPNLRHGAAASALGSELMGPFQRGVGGPGGWFFIIEPEIKFGEHLLVPDIAGWRRERVDSYPDKNYFTLVPDWVCEVLSASTERRDRTAKRRIYAEHRVPHFWIVDPRQQLLEVFELRDGLWALIGTWRSDDEVCAPPFDAISFSLADLWPLDKPLGFHEDPTPYYAGDR